MHQGVSAIADDASSKGSSCDLERESELSAER